MARGGGGGALAGISSALDPNMLRDALLQGLAQRNEAFDLWKTGQKQALAERGAESKRKRETYRTERTRRGRREAEEAPYRRKAMETGQARDIAETQAATGRAPKRRVFVMGAGGFDTPDPLRMTGAQRSRFLPGQATLGGGPTRQELSGLASDQAFDAMLGLDRMRAREAYGSGRG
jgi:hypothetical protein